MRRNYSTKLATSQAQPNPVRKPRKNGCQFEKELHFTIADIEAASKRRDETMQQLEQYGDVLWA